MHLHGSIHATSRHFLRLCLCLSLFACEGVIGENDTTWTSWAPPPSTFEQGVLDFECPSDAPHASEPLRRLSRSQLNNTLSDVLTELLGGESDAVRQEIASSIGAVPSDLRTDHDTQAGQLLFFRSDQSVGAGAVDAHYRLGVALGAALSQPARLNAMGMGCLTDGDPSDGACLDDFVRRVGALTHRRPLADDEFRFYRDVAYTDGNTASAEAIADLIAVIFIQPHFLFHVEGVGELTGHEVAARLSYHFWDTMPDAELRAAAESGEILTEPGWNTQVQRVIADERIRASVRSLLTEWFRFDQINPASSGSGPDFDAIAGDLALDASFDEAVIDELVDLFIHYLRNDGSFGDFFLTDVTTTTHPVLAQLYGVEPAAPGETVAMPIERRSIMTRVGMLLSRAAVALPNVNSITHPILRGVFTRRQVLCDGLEAAPGGAMDNLPVVDRAVSGSREATEILTGATACSGCHGRINSAGYALEAFDAIGQYRTDEPLFDTSGNETMRLPINTRVSILESEGEIEGGAELAETLYESEKVGACFARHYARFALGRSERIVEDGCVLQAIDEAIDAERPLREVLTEVLLAPSFRVRAEN